MRKLLPVCSFNAETCDEGIEALQAYERVYDEVLRNYKDTPKHNWASHGADSFRYLALMWDQYKDLAAVQPVHNVISSAGTKRKKGGNQLPPLIHSGQMRVNGNPV